MTLTENEMKEHMILEKPDEIKVNKKGVVHKRRGLDKVQKVDM